MYTSMLDCFKKSFKSEGLLGMYKGASINIILVTPENAIKFVGNDFFRYHLTPLGPTKISVPRQMLAGALAGTCQIFVTTPMELLKIRMQDAGRVRAEAKAAGKVLKSLSTMGLIAAVYKENGIVGFYKGLAATFCRDVSFAIVYFPLFSTLHDALMRRKYDYSDVLITFTSGLSAGAISAFVITPLDCIKTRLQASKNYHGVMDVVKRTWAEEGMHAFFKGGVCRIIVIAPLFGIAQMVYFIGFAERLLGLK